KANNDVFNFNSLMIKSSIIIPVYNDAQKLNVTLQAIFEQVRFDETVEVIVVDNGSTDDTLEVINNFEKVIFIKETDHLNSPYSCRNRGIEISKGSIIVLLDSTCVPDENWLENGLDYLLNGPADVIGGNVLFD